MNSYERVLEKSRQRLQPDSFLPAYEMGKYSLRSMVQFSEFLGTDFMVIAKRMEEEERTKGFLKIMNNAGIRGANKASMVFAYLDGEERIKALPVIERKDRSSFAWHEDSINHYRNMISENRGSMRIARYPEYFEGEALVVDGYDKPILQVVCRAKEEVLEERLGYIETLSTDFTEAIFCIRSMFPRKFITFNNGQREEKLLDY